MENRKSDPQGDDELRERFVMKVFAKLSRTTRGITEKRLHRNGLSFG